MELDLGPEITAFRGELRDWLAAQPPSGLADRNTTPTTGGHRDDRLAPP